MTTAQGVAARRGRAGASAGTALDFARARLRVVPDATARASSGAFALFVAAVLGLGLLGLLALNTLLTQGSFASTDLARTQAALADQEQALQREVAGLGSPMSLARAAKQLGMVPTITPAFIDPRTGRVLGVPLAGRAAPKPAQPAANPVPAASASTGPYASGSPAPTTGPSTKPAATTSASTKPSAGAKPSTKPSPHPTGATR